MSNHRHFLANSTAENLVKDATSDSYKLVIHFTSFKKKHEQKTKQYYDGKYTGFWPIIQYWKSLFENQLVEL